MRQNLTACSKRGFFLSMFHKMFRTHPLVPPVSVSHGGCVWLFTAAINHVFSAVAPKPYIVRDPVCWLGMIRPMWGMIYRETCSFSSTFLRSLTSTRTLSLRRPGNLPIAMGSAGERARRKSIPGKLTIVLLVPLDCHVPVWGVCLLGSKSRHKITSRLTLAVLSHTPPRCKSTLA